MLSTGASSSKTMSGVESTSDGANRAVDDTSDGFMLGDVGTTNGYPMVDPARFRKLDPPP